MCIRSRFRVLCGLGVSGAWLALALAACGNTRRSVSDEASGAGGGTSSSSGGTDTATSGVGSSGAVAASGSTMSNGGEAGSGGVGTDGGIGAAGAPDAVGCIDGAACTCDDLPGTLRCSGADSSDGGRCSCPAAGVCQAPRGTCFEPCGGDAAGLWVLEQTCFPGVETGQCAGGSIAGTSSVHDVKVLVLENEPVVVFGSESLDLRAQVPLECLGIESVARCKDAEFYASPLFFASSLPLACEPSACGFCECSGNVWGGGGSGTPWTPGAQTLAFGAIDVPYCVQGDTMWAGGGSVGGEPKVAYQFRRRSCVGKPLPCAERQAGQCGTGNDCPAGRCLPNGAQASVCADHPYEESCRGEAGCEWVPGGCWGTASETCDIAYCEGTPGCSWGAPTARCGGQPAACYTHGASDCHVAGCSLGTCDVPDGWGGIDGAPCQRLNAGACSKAAGCTWSGGTCTGTTKCAAQTDATACAMLECAVYDEPKCIGTPTTSCPDLSVEACRSEPGCRLEW